MTPKKVVVSLILCTAAVVGYSEQQGPSEAVTHHPSEAQVKILARNAHTSTDFAEVSTAYDQLHTDFMLKAAQEKQEWDRRSQSTAALAQKYPRPADSARNLYEYFMYKASQMEGLKDKYSKLALPASAK